MSDLREIDDVRADDARAEGDGVPAADDVAKRGLRAGKGGLVTLTTVIALLAATGLTLLGLGAADNAVANYDANSWVWSSGKGEVDRINGITAKVDTRQQVKDARNHDLQITQNDRFLILRDLQTGQVTAMDLATLQVGAVMKTMPGVGVTVVLHEDVAFVIDTTLGQVRQLDPRTLAPTGEMLAFPRGITSGDFDGKGVLWLAVPQEGTVVAITAGKDGASPKVTRTVNVAPPNHDLVLTVLDSGVAVLDNTAGTLTRVPGQSDGGKGGDSATPSALPLTGPGVLPPRSSGEPIPVTVSAERHVVVLDGERLVEFDVPGTGPLQPVVAFAGHFYCADPASGIVYEFDGNGRQVNEIRIPAAGGPLELEVRENHLFINAPDGSTARVVDDKHKVSNVDKYQNEILGGDPPPPPPKPPAPPKPTVTVPGPPQRVNASAGDKSARLTWRKARENGAAITKYVITGGPGEPITVGANTRSVLIEGLTNGETYRFKIHAVNKKGAGPDATSNPVMPTSDVPDPPTEVVAKEQPDGTVDLTWKAANGQGRKIVRYAVTAVAGGTQTPVGDVKTNKMTIAAGTLEYGTQVAFTVVSINDKGGGSEPSEVSNVVIPYAKPGAPGNVSAATVANKKGSVQVSWERADENGRPITKYVVTANGTETEVTDTSATLDGFGDDQAVTVTVAAVNEAGAGPTGTATARTIGKPTVTFTRDTSDYNSVSATFTPNNKGGTATCKVAVSGAGSKSTKCTTAAVTITVTGLWPNESYDYTITITNAAGSASVKRTKKTSTMKATVTCNVASYCSSGVWAYSVPSQTNESNAVRSYQDGAQITPQCRATGDKTVNAKPWGGKQNNKWLGYTYDGKRTYLPWAWAKLDGGDDITMLPAC